MFIIAIFCILFGCIGFYFKKQAVGDNFGSGIIAFSSFAVSTVFAIWFIIAMLIYCFKG